MKKFCVLDQGGNDDTINYTNNQKLFTTEFSDYYRLNFRKINDPNAYIELDFDTLFSEGRCILYEKIPKNYEYYIFIDDDVIFYKKLIKNNKIEWIENSKDIPNIIKDFFDEYTPIHGTFYRELDRHQNHISNKLLKKDVYKIKGFDVTGIFYHHTFIDLVFPVPVHGFYRIFSYQQWICNKLASDKLMCFTKISIFNKRKGSYKNGKIGGSCKLFDGVNLNNVGFENLIKFNNITFDKSCSKTYHPTPTVKNENIKIMNEPVSKKKVIITKEDLKNIFNTESDFFSNRTIVQKKNLPFIENIV